MNRIHKIIWSAIKEKWIVVSEKAGAFGCPIIKHGALTIAALVALYRPALALSPTALPTGGVITAGSGSITTSGSAMTVNQESQKLVADWNTFNIGSEASVAFQQPGATAAALNRIHDLNPSEIMGHLTANGQVFLLNHSGIIFGETSQVNVGGLVATSLDMADSDFLAGKYQFSNPGGAGSVINEGAISAMPGGVVALIAPQVENDGTITAEGGSAALLAGDKVTVDFGGDGLINYVIDQGAVQAQVDNKGLVQADGGLAVMSAQAASDLTSAAVNNTGIVRARTLENKDGQIVLLSDMSVGVTTVAGTLDASAPDGGDGGQVETSGASVKIADGAKIDTRAAYGNTGAWLLDPTHDFTVAASGGDMTGATLSGNLATTNATIKSASGASGGNGDIFMNDSVSWSSGNTLKLNADRNITVNSEINVGGDSKLALKYGQGSADGQISGAPALFTANAPINFGSSAHFTTQLGSSGATKKYTIISTLEELQAISNLDGNYVLGANLDAAGSSFTPIGGFVDMDTYRAAMADDGEHAVELLSPYMFKGSFEGAGHSISNLTIDGASSAFVGLFSATFNPDGASQTVENLTLNGANVEGTIHVGSLTGVIGPSTTVYNVKANDSSVRGQSTVGGLSGLVMGTVASSSANHVTITQSGNFTDFYTQFSNRENYGNLGGLVGSSNGATLYNTSSSGSVTGNDDSCNIGGLAGNANNSSDMGQPDGGIIDSHSSANVSMGNQTEATWSHENKNDDYVDVGSVGGLVGKFSGTEISNSYSTGSVTAGMGHVFAQPDFWSYTHMSGFGGLVGQVSRDNHGSQPPLISNSYSTGSVTVGGSTYNTGGFAGSINASNVSQSYSTGSVTVTGSGGNNIGGFAGQIGSDGSDHVSAITNAYSMGSVTAPVDANGVGGFAGGLYSNHDNTAKSIIDYAYSTGMVIGGKNAGGFIGNNNGVITNAAWDVETSGINTGIGGGAQSGVTGLSTSQMMNLAVSGPWGIIAGVSYPYFLWQYPETPEVISGKLISPNNSSGKSITFADNGSVLAQTTTGANGFYYFIMPDDTAESGTNMLVFVNGDASVKANHVSYVNEAEQVTGFNLYDGFILVSRNSDTKLLKPTDALSKALGNISGYGDDILYTTHDNGNVTLNANTVFWAKGEGGMRINDKVTVTGDHGLGLLSDGPVTQKASIITPGLVVGYSSSGANTSFDLSNSGNQIGLLAGNTGGGNLALTDSVSLEIRSINTGFPGIGTVYGLNAGAGTVALNINGDLTQSYDAPLTAGSLLLAGSGNFDLRLGSGSFMPESLMTATSSIGAPSSNSIGVLAGNVDGDVTVDNGAHALRIGSAGTVSGLTVTGSLTLADTNVVSQDGDAPITAEYLDLQGGSTGQFTLDSASNAIGHLAGNAGSVSLVNNQSLCIESESSDTGLSAATSIDLRTNGEIEIEQQLTASGPGGEIRLDSSEGVSQESCASVSADKLQIKGSGTFDLTGSENRVGTLASDVTGDVSLNNGSTHLTIGSVGAVKGAHVSGTLTLADTNGVTQDSDAPVSADKLLLTGSGNFDLTLGHGGASTMSASIYAPSGNSIGTLAGNVDGDVSVDNGNNLLTIGTVGSVHGLNVTGTLTLADTNEVTQNCDAPITADKLDLEGGAAYTLTSEANRVDTLVGNVGSLDFRNNGSLNIGLAAPVTIDSLTMMSADGAGLAAQGPVQIVASGECSNITLNNTISSGASGNAVVLAAGGTFTNNAGASAISLSGTDARWLIYSADPSSDTFGAPRNVLASGNKAIWNATFETLSPEEVSQSGNRYLFSVQPTLTFTSTDLTKTYGDDLTGSIGSAYTYSGLRTETYGGAIVADEIGDFSAPEVTSDGAVATAGVHDSPYTIAISGEATASNGYKLEYVSDGRLTVNKASLTVTANDDSKVYNGLEYSGGNGVTYDGFVNDESSSVLGGELSYGGDSQGAVNAGSYSIDPTGLRSCNYAISYVNGTLTVDKANYTSISGSKIYDGTADFSDVTLKGVNDETFTVASATSNSKNVVDAKSFTDFSGGITGTGDALTSNYESLDLGSLANAGHNTATIDKANYTSISGIKTYDGNADFSDVTLKGVNDETFTVASATSNSKNVLEAKSFTGYSGGISGQDGALTSNYESLNLGALESAGHNTATITPADFTSISGSKTYNGNTDFSNVALTGVNGETFMVASATSNSKNVLEAKSFTDFSGGITGTGDALASNYTSLNLGALESAGHNTATITPASYTSISGSKTYDGNTGFNNVALTGVNNETFTVATATSNSANVVGASNFVSYTGDINGQSGALTSNYESLDLGSLTGSNNTATITPANYTSISGIKTYDGNASFSDVTLKGVNNETFTVAKATSNSKNVLEAKSFTDYSGGISGQDGALTSNYTSLDLGSLNGSNNTATITPTNYTSISGIKTYDGNADFSDVTLKGVNDETFTVASAMSNSKNVLEAKSFTGYSGGISGQDGALTSNYTSLDLGSLNGSNNTATITPTNYTSISGIKTYDGNADFSDVTLKGVNDETFTVASATSNSKNVLEAKSFTDFSGGITGTGDALTSNYESLNLGSLESAGHNTATITPASYSSISGSKRYDGNADFSDVTLKGVNDETFTVASATSNSKNVLEAKSFTDFSGGITGTGDALTSNYTSLNLGALESAGLNSAKITPASYTSISGSKRYDGNADFSDVTLKGVNDETFTVATATSNSKNVLEAKSFTGYSGDISGQDGALTSNYESLDLGSLNGSNNTATITPATVTLAGTKVYDQTTTFAASVFGTSGEIGTGIGRETLALSGSGSVDSKDVVAGTQVLSLGTLALHDGTGLVSNYEIALSGNTGAITPKSLNVTGLSVDTKIYDGATSATFTGSANIDGVYSGDTVTITPQGPLSVAFVTKDVGTDKPVSVTGGYELTGNDASNYTLNSVSGVTGTITPAYYTSIIGSKSYSGNADFSNVTVTGVNGETFTQASATATGQNVGDWTFTSTGGALTGNSGALTTNYFALDVLSLTGLSNTATITPASYTAISGSKVYDGNASFSNVTLSGVNGESFMVASATSNSANVLDSGSFLSYSGDITGNGSALTSNYYALNVLSHTGTSNTAAITPATVTLAGTKVYDTITTFAGTAFGAAGVIDTGIGGETLSVSGTGTVGSANVIAGTQTLDATALALVDATGLSSNYQIAMTGNTGTITPASYTSVSGSKVYDGNTGFSNVALSGVNGESFTVASATSNSANLVGVSNFVSYTGDITGNGGALTSNYAALDLGTLTAGNNTASITPASYTSISGSKVYDGNASFSNVTLSGVNGESFTVASAASNSANVLDASSFISYTGAITGQSGALTSNYAVLDLGTLTGTSNTASITPANYTSISSSKTYDGNASFSNVALSGVNGESFTVASATSNSANVLDATTFTGYAGAITGNGGALATNYTVLDLGTLTGSSNTASITPASYTAISGSKVYDGNSGFSNVALNGVNGESFTVASATSNSANVLDATNFVSYTGAITGQSGALATNYAALDLVALTGTSNTASISPATITLAGTKVYDQSTSFAGTAFGTAAVIGTGIGSETLSVSGTGAVGSKNVTADPQALDATSLALADGTGLASNYQIATTGNTGIITPKTLNVTGLSVDTKSYDGSTSATFTGTSTIDGVSIGDLVNIDQTNLGVAFVTSDAGTSKSVSLTNVMLTGADAGNYTLISVTGVTGTVNQASYQSITGSKSYNGNADFSNVTVTGVNGETFTQATATATGQNAGAWTFTSTGGLLTGNNGALTSNYAALDLVALTGTANTATITPATITLAGSKVYDQSATFASSAFGVAGVIDTGIAGETLTVSGTGTVASANVADGTQALDAASIALVDGTGLASNYQIATTGNTGIITPATVTLAGTKVYDAATSFASSAFGVAGVIDTGIVGETLTVSGSGMVASANVADGTQALDATLLILGDGTGLASNYQIATTGNTGIITPASYQSITGSKMYDGNTGFSNVALSGVNGESFTVASATSNSANVLNSSSFTGYSGDITGNGSALTSNYATLNLGALTGSNNTATITPANYTSISGSKTYDGNADFSSVALTGVNGESFTVASATSNSANVLEANRFESYTGDINGNGGALATNYATLDLGTLTGSSNTATITPANYTSISGIKTYDGNADFSDVTLTGVNGETFTVATATSNSKNVLEAKSFTDFSGGISGQDGALTSNYTSLDLGALTGSNNTAMITPANYTSISGSKRYDGNTGFSNVALSGVNGETFTVATATSNSANVLDSSSFTGYAGGISGQDGALTSNYTSLDLGSLNGSNNTATITPANYTSISGSKRYDGSTGFSNVALSGVNGESFTVASATSNSVNVLEANRFESYTGDISGNGGALASNYATLDLGMLTGSSNTATITPANYTSITGSKTYDGNTGFSNVALNGVNDESFIVASASSNSANVVGASNFVSYTGDINGNGGALTSNYNALELTSLTGSSNTATITPANYTSISGSKTYDGNTGFSDVTLKGVNNETFTVATATSNSKNVLEAKSFTDYSGDIRGQDGALTSNYESLDLGSLNGSSNTATITPANYAAISGSKMYDGNTGFSNVTLSGVNGESFTVASATSNSANVLDANTFTGDTGDITGNGSALTSNYNALELTSLTGSSNTATINTAEYQSINGRKTYDGNANFSNVTLTGVNGETFTVASATSNSANVVDSSSFTGYSGAITGNGSALTSNYNALELTSLTGSSNTATVDKSSYTSINGKKTYDGNANFSNVELKGVNGETFVVESATSNSKNVPDAKNFISYTGGITGNGGALTTNYNELEVSSLTGSSNTVKITTASLTVTANDDGKVFDGLAYSGGNGVTYDGFVNDETESVLGGSLTYGGDSQGAVNVGGYSIDPTGLASGNYEISYVNGVLTVEPAVTEPPQVTPQGGDLTPQGNPPSGSFTLIDINGAVVPGSVVVLVNANPDGIGGSIQVSVPSDQGQLSGGFLLSLPPDIIDPASPFTITLEGGGELPSWLTYDPATQSFTATNVLAGTRSVKVVINQGGKSWTVEISASGVTQ